MAVKWSWRAGVSFVIAVCVGLLGWVAFDLQRARERELQSAELLGGTLTKLLEGHFLGSVRQADHLLTDFAARFQSAVVERRPRAEVEAQLRHYVAQFPEAQSFRVVDAQGRYLYDATGQLSKANVADRDYFIRLRDDRRAGVVVSEPLVSRVSGEVVVVFARRLEDRNGGFAGVVLTTLRAEHFERYYRGLDVGRKGVIALWNHDMVLFARWPRSPAQQGQRLAVSPIPQRLAKGELAGSFRQVGHLDGIERVFAYRAIEGVPLVFSVGFATDDVLAEWQGRATTYGVLGAGLLIALLALLRAWSRGYREAEALAERMTRAYADKARESRALLDSIPDPAWLLDNDGRFRAVNEAFCRYRHQPMERVIGSTVDQLFPPDEAQRLHEGQRLAYEKGQTVRQVVWLNHRGKPKPFEFMRVPVYGEDGKVCGLAGVAWDMSERFEAEERQRLITHFFDHASDAVLILDRERRVLTLNKAVTAISGYELEDLKGRELDFVLERFEDVFMPAAIIDTLASQGRWQGELKVMCKDGSPLPVSCLITAIHNDEGQPVNWSVFVADLSERKAAQARIESLTNFDQLTGMPNRQGLSKVLGEWLSGGQQGLLMVLELDGQLSRVNEAFGHAAGDTVLRRLAVRLSRSLDDGDALGRLGGHRFGLLRRLDSTQASPEVFVRKLLDNLSRPVSIEGNDVVLNACVGICRLFEDGDEVPLLLRNADTALHHARDAGQGSFRFFSADMNLRMTERLRLESDLRNALAGGEFELHYQPQVDLRSGTLVGFECLLRWHHPELGPVSPVRFIPIAEESRLIIPIGAWVLEEACRQNKAWQDTGMPPKVVAVNLSAVQFHGTDVVGLVKDVLARTGLPAACLELEITESVIVEDPERVVQLMAALKAIGVGLSIDDFGTGYSSLSYLQRFPIDKIKIDRAFVRDLETNANDAAIVRMVIGMAAELAHKVIAEGVETEGQLAFLRDHGCDEYQGFLCSPAVPAAEIPRLVAAHEFQ